MMPIEGNVPEQKIVTKKHLARLEKEKRQRKILLISTISVLGIIVFVLFILPFVISLIRPTMAVATVNSEKITVGQFQKRVRYERLEMERLFLNYRLSPYAQFFQSQMLDIQNQLDDYYQFSQKVLNNMINESLITQKAKELGITVTEEEVNVEIEKYFNFYENGTPTPTATVEYRPTSTLSSAQLAIITLTPTPSPTEIPTATAEPATATPDLTTTSTATPTTTEVQVTNTPAAEIPAATATATEIPPTPTVYTREGFETLYATVVANYDSQTKFGDEDFRSYFRNQIFKRKLYELITKDVTNDQEMVWARHILVATEEEAKDLKARLDAGEDFVALAAAYSQDSTKTTGGDLGWISKGIMVAEFENAAWALNIGEISQPVQSSFGYHIIQVLGHEVRQLTADELSSSKGVAFTKYFNEIQAAGSTKINSIWESVIPVDPAIPAEYLITAQQ